MKTKGQVRRRIRCHCGGIARAMFPTKPAEKSVEGLYACGACGDITEAATRKVIGGGLNIRELRQLGLK